MKSLTLLGLLMTLSLTSCGGDNEAGEAGEAGPGVSCSNLQAASSANAVKTHAQFITEVEANRFQGSSSASTYSLPKIQSAILTSSQPLNVNCSNNNSSYDPYYYQDPYSNNSSQYSGLGFRRIDGNGAINRNVSICGTNYQFSEDNEFGASLCTLKARLVLIMRNATSVKKCQDDSTYNYVLNSGCVEMKTVNTNTGYYNIGNTSSNLTQRPANVMIFTYGGKEYTIDKTKPLAKNPVFVKAAGSSTTYNSGSDPSYCAYGDVCF